MPTLSGMIRRVGRAVKFGRFDSRSVFEHIYKTRYWGSRESVSGMGSRLDQTVQVRSELVQLMRRHDIETIFDAPCGDLNWMKEILKNEQFGYTGGDIVEEVVELARKNCPRNDCHFLNFDITRDPFPDADMWICRDVLFHLSYKQIYKSLENFCSSKIKFILVTSHTSDWIKNRNIVTGDFRQLDLLKPPFNFDRDHIIDRITDFSDPAPPRDLILLRREHVARKMN